jgi:hypothetical protein
METKGEKEKRAIKTQTGKGRKKANKLPQKRGERAKKRKKPKIKVLAHEVQASTLLSKANSLVIHNPSNLSSPLITCQVWCSSTSLPLSG